MIEESIEYLVSINRILVPKKLKAIDYYTLRKAIELYQKKEDDFFINELTQEVVYSSNEAVSKIRTSIRRLVNLGYIGKYRDKEDERKVYLTFYGKYYDKFLELEKYIEQNY